MIKRIPSSLLFIVAAIYLATQGEMCAITVLAVISCAVCSVLALSNLMFWGIVGGIGLIATSLALQVALNHYCQTCLRADLLILSAISSLAICQKEPLKKPARWLTCGTILMFIIAVMLNTPSNVDLPALATKEIVVQHPEQGASQDILLDTEETPVLIFSPNCPACKRELEVLMNSEEQIQWQPVLSTNSPDQIQEAKELLDSLGYVGELYTTTWENIVPTVIYYRDGELKIEHTVQNLLPHT